MPITACSGPLRGNHLSPVRQTDCVGLRASNRTIRLEFSDYRFDKSGTGHEIAIDVDRFSDVARAMMAADFEAAVMAFGRALAKGKPKLAADEGWTAGFSD
jgi:hypothetical protein